MAPVKLPVGYKCRLFGSSRNSLGLGEYGCDNDGRSANSIPPGTPAEGARHLQRPKGGRLILGGAHATTQIGSSKMYGQRNCPGWSRISTAKECSWR
jgi:hypothetical protein